MQIAFEAHVLREVFRFHEFTDVVKVRADAAERRVCANGFRAGFGEIGHDEAVVIGPWRFDGHAS